MTPLERHDYLNSLGYAVISDNLSNSLEVMCSNRHIFKRPFSTFIRGVHTCTECIKEEKTSKLAEIGFTPISADLSNKLEVVCSKGHVFKRAYKNFIEGAVTCPICDVENSENRVEYMLSIGYKILSENTAGEMIVQCENGHIIYKGYNNIIKNGITCIECEKDKKRKYIESLNFTIISENIGHGLELMCDNGHTFPRGFGNIIQGAAICPICFPKKSAQELEIRDFLLNNGIEFIQSDKSILGGQELDFYIPGNNIAIEYNGIYWHSENVGRGKKFHISKTKKCENVGINLLHIMSSEWVNPVKKEIWKSIILGKMGRHDRIFARKCTIVEIDRHTSSKFLDENHLQGNVRSSIRYGLYHNGDLVSVMSFGVPRSNKKYQWEMMRFASKLHISVIGGASKLFKHFLRNNEGSVVSYSDKRYSMGNMYSQLGFNHRYDSSPNYSYFMGNGSVLQSRQTFMKHKLSSKLHFFDPNLTEWENMKLNGYNRIWDCGNGVWTYTP